jgi:hypothetical protein
MRGLAVAGIIALFASACGSKGGAVVPRADGGAGGNDAGPSSTDVGAEAEAGGGGDADARAADAGDEARAEADADAAAEGGGDVGADAAGGATRGEADGGACATLAASCLGTFFQTADACFAPTGSCQRAVAGSRTTYCWQSGARFITDGASVAWLAGTRACAHGSRLVSNGKTELSLILDAVTAAPLYYYVVETGETVCEGTPGRTTLDPALKSCPAFTALLAPDVSACQAGACS